MKIIEGCSSVPTLSTIAYAIREASSQLNKKGGLLSKYDVQLYIPICAGLMMAEYIRNWTTAGYNNMTMTVMLTEEENAWDVVVTNEIDHVRIHNKGA